MAEVRLGSPPPFPELAERIGNMECIIGSFEEKEA